MQKVKCIKDYLVSAWPTGYLVPEGTVLYYHGFWRGVHHLHLDSKQSFVVFGGGDFQEHFKIVE